MYCSGCGNALPPDARFCPACGKNNGPVPNADGGAQVAPTRPATPVARVEFKALTFTPLSRAVGRWLLAVVVGFIAASLFTTLAETLLPRVYNTNDVAIPTFFYTTGVGCIFSIGLSPGKAWNRSWLILGSAAVAGLIELYAKWYFYADGWWILAFLTMLILLSIVGFSETVKRQRWVNLVAHVPWYHQRDVLVVLLPVVGLVGGGIALLTALYLQR